MAGRTNFKVDSSYEDPDGNDAVAVYMENGTFYEIHPDGSVEELGGGGGAHPSLAVHDALGVATQGELDAHEVAPDPHTIYELAAQKGVADGYASLDGSGVVPDAQIPSTVARDSELPDLAGHVGAADPHPLYALDTDLASLDVQAYGSDDGGTSWTPLLVLSDGTLVVTN